MGDRGVIVRGRVVEGASGLVGISLHATLVKGIKVVVWVGLRNC